MVLLAAGSRRRQVAELAARGHSFNIPQGQHCITIECQTQSRQSSGAHQPPSRSCPRACLLLPPAHRTDFPGISLRTAQVKAVQQNSATAARADTYARCYAGTSRSGTAGSTAAIGAATAAALPGVAGCEWATVHFVSRTLSHRNCKTEIVGLVVSGPFQT